MRSNKHYPRTGSILFCMGIVVKARIFATESQHHQPDGAITLFADDNFRLAFVLRVRVANFIAIDKGHL